MTLDVGTTSVLIVDDNAELCRLLEEELNSVGYQCLVALSGSEAEEKLSQFDCDVVLLDIKLPDVSGIDVLRKIKTGHPNTAVIMITVVRDIAQVVECMKNGASDYLTKPFDFDRLLSGVRIVLGSRGPAGVIGQVPVQPLDKCSRLDAIAAGVEARLDLGLNYHRTVTEQTTRAAMALDIPIQVIIEWQSHRMQQWQERRNRMSSLLAKLRATPSAQIMLGLSEAYRWIDRPPKQN